MKSLAIISIVAATALAQSAQQHISPLIPAGISEGCKNTLAGFDSDPSLQSCTASIISATQDYVSGGKAMTASGLTSALDKLCSQSTCADSTIRTVLASFYQNCPDELTGQNPNKDVISLYETFYSMMPFRTAACTKADDGTYCAASMGAKGSNGAGKTLLASTFNPADLEITSKPQQQQRRADGDNTIHQVNGAAFAANNVLFLFMDPNANSSVMCTSCMRNVMTSYINFESNVPYAPAKSNSMLFSGQTNMYNAVQKTCGTNFLNSAVQAAGGIGSGIVGKTKTGGALSSVSSVGAPLTVALGAMTLAVTTFL
jgi:hypothetical protein